MSPSITRICITFLCSFPYKEFRRVSMSSSSSGRQSRMQRRVTRWLSVLVPRSAPLLFPLPLPLERRRYESNLPTMRPRYPQSATRVGRTLNCPTPHAHPALPIHFRLHHFLTPRISTTSHPRRSSAHLALFHSFKARRSPHIATSHPTIGRNSLMHGCVTRI